MSFGFIVNFNYIYLNNLFGGSFSFILNLSCMYKIIYFFIHKMRMRWCILIYHVVLHYIKQLVASMLVPGQVLQ